MAHKIFSPRHAITAMKNSGYKDAAHSIAELIDNSIQAGEGLERTTEVEVICIEEETLISNRHSSRIRKIAVYDNAAGMTPEVLAMALSFGEGTRKNAKTGMGKFGIGLPNASIAQSNRVEVWTWQKSGEFYHTYLDSDEIIDRGYDEVPEPELSDKLPDEWVPKIKTDIGENGTLVIWSKLERLKWRRHKAFFSNTEFIVGRMYRYFINDEKCRIRMAAYASGNSVYEKFVKPNDPLNLMENTVAPEPFDKKPGFEPFGEGEWRMNIPFKGESNTVKLKFSIARQDYRRELTKKGKRPGDTLFGKHCAKNQGVSVVRAGREIEISPAFDIAYDPVDRWWGVEVSFDPALDEVFGVINNKQVATAFRRLSLSDIAIQEDIPEGEVKAFLQQEEDIRLPVIDISNEISSKLKAIRDLLDNQTKSVKVKKEVQGGADDAQKAATSVTATDGKRGLSDELEKTLSQKEKKAQLSEELEKDGIETDQDSKNEIIKKWLTDSKYIFNSVDLRSSRVIFDISQPAGKIKVTINSKHPAYEHFIKQVEEEDLHSFNTLKLLFAAWARMEDVEAQTEERKEILEDIRIQWGTIAKNMIDEYTS